MKIIFLETLPHKIYNKIECVDWEKAKGNYVKFIYDNIEDYFFIEDVNLDNRSVKILYNGISKWTGINLLLNNKLSKAINKVTVEFKYNISQAIKNNNKDIIIIGREYRKKEITNKKNGRTYTHNQKWYKYHCNKCGSEDWVTERSINQNLKSNCCSRISFNNLLVDKRPDLIKFVVNINEIKNVAIKSKKIILCKCPNCEYKKEQSIKNLTKYGFSCPVCSDGISYPEKVMSKLLHQLKIDFKTQLSKITFNWCNQYRYDFYFIYNNEEYIIETHGGQHYVENYNFKMSLEEVQENDRIKKELALKNNIKENNYIVIDCRKSELEWIKNNILHSKLNELFDLSNIDWHEIDRQSQKSLVKEVCEYWNLHENNKTSQDVASIFNLSRKTIVEYLKKGSDLNILKNKYNGKHEIKKGGILKEQNENNPNYKSIFMYDINNKKLLCHEYFQKDIGKWLYENKLCSTEDCGKKIVNNILRKEKGYHKFKNGLEVFISYDIKYINSIEEKNNNENISRLG